MAAENIPRLERRGKNRLVIPSCRSCGKPAVRVATRTDYYLYFRCGDCWHIWSVPKPGQTSVGT